MGLGWHLADLWRNILASNQLVASGNLQPSRCARRGMGLSVRCHAFQEMSIPALRQKRVGEYKIGAESVEVFIRDGNGGEFYFMPEPGRLPRIKIGGDQSWNEVMATVLHEAMEYAFCRSQLRFSPAPEISPDNGSYMFCMNHTQFSVAVGSIASFVADLVPDLQRAYKKFSK